MNKQDDCMSFEVLRKEVQTLDGETFVSDNDKRLLINPECVESMDNSDGSEQFSPEALGINLTEWKSIFLPIEPGPDFMVSVCPEMINLA